MRHARHVVETHRNELIPRAQSALDLTLRHYELGRQSFLALTQARQVLVELRHAQVGAAARYHALLVDLDRLTAAGAAP
jgi:cobalt-zinc-cadmium efflux system outer membrane protein